MARILILLALCATSVADAALIGWPEIVERSLPGAPAGHVVNGMLINFDGQLFGQQLVVRLNQGAIYQDGFGSVTAPSSAIIPVFPSLAADSFVTIGGFTASTSSNVSTSRGIELGGPQNEFDTEIIDIMWAPAPGVVVNGGTDFPIAQITLTNDALGSWQFFSNSGSVGSVRSGGILNGRLYNVPEPASLVVAGFGAIAAALRATRRE